MSLAGELSGFGIEEIVTLITSGRKSGSLTLTFPSSQASLAFDAGILVEAMHGPQRGTAALSAILSLPAAGQFVFREQAWEGKGSLRMSGAEFAALAAQMHGEESMLQPLIPPEDEQLAIAVSFEQAPQLTPLQWRLLAAIPSRQTLRNLLEGQDRLRVEHALAPLLQAGLVRRSGQKAPSTLTGRRFKVVWGERGNDDSVEVDRHVVASWRGTGTFSGKVAVAGQPFLVLPRDGLEDAIVISADVCRSMGIRNTQEITVTPLAEA